MCDDHDRYAEFEYLAAQQAQLAPSTHPVDEPFGDREVDDPFGDREPRAT